MRIQLNGAPHELADNATLAELITAATGSLRGSAAAVDGTVVPRTQWAETRLHPDQAVELITAVQGG
jgi:sulfur carrier protein